jgi:hypothetical protein
VSFTNPQKSRLFERCNHYCLHSPVASASFLTCASKSSLLDAIFATTVS